jgi:hypothetical protein
MVKARRLSIESMEDRMLLSASAFGIPWPNAEHLTLSFPADGSVAVGQPNQLNAILNAETNQGPWHQEMMRALQTWSAAADINIGLVSDGGQPLNAAGPPQGNPNFGDIRIAGAKLDPSLVASSSPFNPTAGTESGNVIFNTAMPFGIGSGPSYDIFTIMLHEAGHVFGLADNNDPGSVMYGNYQGVWAAPGSSDLIALQALYGPRPSDGGSNDTLASATGLKAKQHSGGLTFAAFNGDISTPTDVDWYQLKGLDSLDASAGIDVRLRGGISLLKPKFSVYENGVLLASSSSAGPLTGDLAINFKPKSGAKYAVKVESNSPDLFGVGGYRLTVSSAADAAAIPPWDYNDNGQDNNDNQVPNDSFDSAIRLTTRSAGANPLYSYSYQASLNASGDADFYKLKALQMSADTSVMTILAWSLQSGEFNPKITLFDQLRNPMPADVLVSQNGTYVIQFTNALPQKPYYVEVQATDPQHPAGEYFLGVNFSFQAVHQETSPTATLDASRAAASASLTLNQGTLLHLGLKALANGSTTQTIQLTILDLDGNVLRTITARAGDTATTDVYLGPGTYTFNVKTIAADGSASMPIQFQLDYLALTDAIGPLLSSTTSTTSTGGGGGSGGGGGGSSTFMGSLAWSWW